MGKDLFRIKVYRCDRKEFDSGIADFETAVERSFNYMDKMQPDLDIQVRRGRRR